MYPLRTFYNNESEREAVRAFMIETLEDIVIKKAFAGESVEGAPAAREAIDEMFNRLEEEYGAKPEPVITNSR